MEYEGLNEYNEMDEGGYGDDDEYDDVDRCQFLQDPSCRGDRMPFCKFPPPYPLQR
jgi:hypothetical protein